MRNFVYILLTIAIISCTDLEEDPIGILPPSTFVQTPEDLQVLVNGSYAAVASEEFWGRKLTLTLLLKGDMATIGDRTTSSRRINIDEFQVDQDNGMITEFWPRAYVGIAAANFAIESSERLSAFNEADVNAIVGQARFMRGFIYYHMVRIFGPLPYVDFIVNDATQVSDLSRMPESEIYEKIQEDFEFAKTWLPETQSLRSLPSSGTAAAYLASVNLTLGNWQKAYDEAKFVIDNKGAFNFNLEADFQNLFIADIADGLTEPLFVIDFRGADATDNFSRDYLAPLTGMRGPDNEGWSVAVPTVDVFDSFTDGDYRKEVSFDTEAVFDGEVVPWQEFGEADRGVSRPHIAKYYRFPGSAGLNNRDSDNNYATMRYAEVLLIAAEAANNLFGPTSEAIGYVNEIRSRARNGSIDDTTPRTLPEDITTGVSQEEFEDLIIEERRVELAFEFKRWYDIKRLQIGPEVFDMDGLEPQNFNPDRDYLLPIPGDEIGRNPNLLPQNPGY